MKNFKLFLLTLFAAISSLYAENPFAEFDPLSYKPNITYMPSEINEYDGRPLTPELIVNALAPQMPAETRADMERFYKNNEALIKQVLATSRPLGKFRDKSALDKQSLQAAKLQNESAFNIVIDPTFTHGEYRIKMTGQGNRVCLLFCADDKEYILNEGPLSRIIEECEKIDVRPTHQTLSRMATHLRLLELKKKSKDGLDKIVLPTMYVLTPDESKPTSDENCIVVEEYVLGTKLTTGSPELNNLTYKHLKQLYAAIMYAGIWELAGNFIVDKNGNIVLNDLEQQNRTYPPYHNTQATGFYHQSNRRTAHVYACGIESVAKLLEKSPDQAKMWGKIVLGNSKGRAIVKANGHILNAIDQHIDKAK